MFQPFGPNGLVPRIFDPNGLVPLVKKICQSMASPTHPDGPNELVSLVKKILTTTIS